MSQEKSLLLVYGYLPKPGKDAGPYLMLNIVDERALIDNHTLRSALNSSTGSQIEDFSEIRFKSLEDLNKFSYSLMGELDVPEVCLLSAEDYNTCLEKSASVEELRTHIDQCSNKLKNVDFKRSQKPFIQVI